MEKDDGFTPLNGDERRQYINARETFKAVRAAEFQARDCQGTMRWRTMPPNEYLIAFYAGAPRKARGGVRQKRRWSMTLFLPRKKCSKSGSKHCERDWH